MKEGVTPGSVAEFQRMDLGLLTKYGESLREPVGSLIWAGTEVAEMSAGSIDCAVRAGQAAAIRAAASLVGSCGIFCACQNYQYESHSFSDKDNDVEELRLSC